MATANGGATAPAAPKVGAEDAGAGAAAPQQNVSSLSEMEWKSMEVPLEAQTKNTHLSLQKWLADRARVLGIRAKQAEEDEDDDDESDDEDGTPASNKGKAQATPAQQQEVEEKNWSQVNLAFQESKLSWKQSFNPYNFTNWLWCHVVRNRLEESKGNVEDFAEGDLEKVVEGVQDVHDILAEFIPADQVKKDKDRPSR
ncbi:unnamed protein product [Amoebophrya sp. A120]|nr:unnamed protein product [Amoebophrya sp. A120]|eukprot:GSA120T00000749001.1